jgi:TonB family protein
MKLAMSLCVAFIVCQAVAGLQTRPGGIEGYVTDADGGLLPGVAVSVSSANLQPAQALTDARGRFNVPQLAAGDYQVSLQLPGFRTARGVVAVKPGAASGVTFQMAIGSLEEVVTVRSLRPAATAQPAPQAAPTGPVRIGGSIREPRKIKDVRPVFSPEADQAGAEGIVVIDAVIGKDGNVSSARVLQGVPLLNGAALAAVRQWQYTPTLLNGAPVEVLATVTVWFVR